MITRNPKNSKPKKLQFLVKDSPVIDPFNYRHYKVLEIISQYTQIPNIVFGGYEEGSYTPGLLSELSGNEVRTLLVFLRMTLGYHQSSFHLSIKNLEKLTGISEKTLHKAIGILIDKNLLNRQISYRNYKTNLWSLPMEEDTLWPDLPDKETRTMTYDFRINNKNWTPVSNEFLGGWTNKHMKNFNKERLDVGAISRANPTPLKVQLLVLRFSLGYRKLSHNFPSKEVIQNLAKVSRRTLYNLLEERELITNSTGEFALPLTDKMGKNSLPTEHKSLEWEYGNLSIYARS